MLQSLDSPQTELIATYGPALRATCDRITSSNPTLIVALSRKGPRLLDILRKQSFFRTAVPIVTEKALAAMRRGSLQSSNVVVFDDIVISGTTIANLAREISVRLGAQVYVHTVAVDRDTISFHRVSECQYRIAIPGETIRPLSLFASIELSSAERFAFCDAEVAAFQHLAKPYDIDLGAALFGHTRS